MENGFDPLTADASFPVTVDAGEPTSQDPVTAGVYMDLANVKDPNVSRVTKVEDGSNPLISTDIAGYLGNAYEFQADGDVNSARVTFRYDTSLGTIGESFQPRIYYLDEDEGTLEELPDQTVSDGVISASVPHFSTYILLNKVDADAVWDQEIKAPLEGDDSGEDPTIDVVFVIDYSKSMTWNDPDQLCKQLSKEFVSKLRDGKDQAAVVEFIRVATIVSGLTTDKDALNSAIDGINYDDGHGTNSGTDGSTGLKAALDVLSGSQAKYRYVILIMDGEDNGYTYSYADLIDDTTDQGVKVYTIGMGTANETTLTDIATKTGGKYYRATAAVDLSDVFGDIESETVDLTTDTNQDGILSANKVRAFFW